jgi:hypothetical protein
MKLPIRTPCPTRPILTDAGDGTSRCSRCPKRVHHLSRMTEDAGKVLIERSKTEDVCVHYIADQRGHIQFAPVIRAAAAVAFLAVSPVAMADGGDVVASALAEVNRIQDDASPKPSVSPDAVTVATQTNQDRGSESSASTHGTEPEIDPEDSLIFLGGI